MSSAIDTAEEPWGGPAAEDHAEVAVLLIGDIVGKSGRAAVKRHLSQVVEHFRVEVVIANGENAAGGVGITPAVAADLFALGVDVLTTGNHVWKHKEILDYLPREPRLLRPHNHVAGVPGQGGVVVTTHSGARIGVLNLLGRVFMDPIDCPFRTADGWLASIRLQRDAEVVIVDFHAEATSEKVAMAVHLDGRVSAVLGTHTHIPTADHRLMPRGTAAQTDVGMTGCYDSVIGMSKPGAMGRFLTGMPTRFEAAEEEGTFCGTVVVVDRRTGLARRILPVRRGGMLSPTPW